MSNFIFSAMVACILGGSNDECIIATVSPPGTVNQQGYKFKYQSGVGPSKSGKLSCLLHRVQNTRGGPSASVEWKEDGKNNSLVYLQAWLDECPNGNCPWDEAVLPTSHDIVEADTFLGFGANSNQYNVTPSAYRRKPAQTSKTPPLTTILRRVFGGDDPPKADDEREVVLGVQVTSSVEGEEAPYTLRYTITALEKNNTYQLFQVPKLEGNTAGIFWDNVPRADFLARLKAMEVHQLNADRREVTVAIQANEFEVNRENKLRILQRRGEKVRTILAATAAAYVPKKPN